LWPDSADPGRNLRQQLLRFKQQFGQAVLAGEAQLMLAPGVVLSESSAPLLQAQRYDDCTEFLAWLEGQRAALNTQHAVARRAVLAQAEAAGDLDTALDAAQRGVAEEVGCEASWQELMRIHYLRGEPAAGLAVYQRLNDLLQTRYGTPPAAASTELADALRRADRHTPDARGATAWPTAQPARALPVTLKRPPLLAGRDAELAAVQEAWPAKWTCFHLYVILDIFSRFVVGWLIAPRECSQLAQQLIADTVSRHNVESVFLGSKEFLFQMQARLSSGQPLRNVPLLQQRPVRRPLAHWQEQFPRDEGICGAVASGRYRMLEVADGFGVSLSTVSRRRVG